MRAALTLTLLGVVTLTVPGARAYRSGAPEWTCNTMTPSHTGGAVEALPPFSVTVSSDTYQPGSSLQVRIVPSDGRTFKGFMIQARPAGNPDVSVRFGVFTPVAGTKLVCGTSGVTHTSNSELNSMTLDWSTVSDLQGDIVFRATVVESFNVWYTSVDSNVIRAVSPTTTTTTSTLPPTTTTTTTTTTPPPTTTTTTTTIPTTTTTTPVPTTTTLPTTTTTATTTTTTVPTTTTTTTTPAPVTTTSSTTTTTTPVPTSTTSTTTTTALPPTTTTTTVATSRPTSTPRTASVPSSSPVTTTTATSSATTKTSVTTTPMPSTTRDTAAGSGSRGGDSSSGHRLTSGTPLLVLAMSASCLLSTLSRLHN